jgi:AAA family ATP:ADP antiporter
MTDAAVSNPIKRIIKATTKVEPNEVRATVLSFLFVFSLMAAYFIIRPVRDAMASDWTRAETSWLWTATFFCSIIAVSVYGAVLSRVRFSRVVPGAYIFFALSFTAFYFGSQAIADPTIVDKMFYVWLSVFSLFHISVFWSFMSGLFSKEQAPRLFAIIASGASIGGIVGAAISGFLAEEIGVMNLMLISAAVLLIPIPLIGELNKLKVTELGNKELKADLSRAKKLGKNPFAGFLLFIKNPYLLAIGVFILMYVAMSTFIYMELREMLAVYERPERTEILGRIDFWSNLSVVVIAFFATGRLATRFGMATTLALVPFLMIGGWLVVAAAPFLAVLIGLQISRKAGNYAITRPGREMLFTLVDDETRYKAKPVIDIVVYRGGDMAMAWFHTFLRDAFAFGLGGIAVIAAVIAAVWAMMGVYLGRTYNMALDDEVGEAQTGQ